MKQRRTFLLQVISTTGAMIGAGSAFAQAAAPKAADAKKPAAANAPANAAALPLVDEKSPQAAPFAYVADTTKVDAKKYPKHTKEQKCSTCSLYQKVAGLEKQGGCPLFPKAHVAAEGWCTAYVKKA